MLPPWNARLNALCPFSSATSLHFSPALLISSQRIMHPHIHAMHHILCRLHNMYQVHWRALSAGLGPTAAGPGVKSEECPVPNIPLRMHICCTQPTTQMAKLPWGCPLPARSALALPPITDHRTCIATHRASPRTYFTLHTLYTHCENMQLVGANFVHLLMHLLPASH